ncbi:MAG: ABC transporter substrate-binding protein [Methyloligellaceae bacterium]
MRCLARAIAVASATALVLVSTVDVRAEEIKIGVLFDYTGKLAPTSSVAAAGARIAIDMVNERGGVEGRQVKAIYADAQSKPDVALKEAERLFGEQKVVLLTGVYASSQCVPLARKLDAEKRFFWASVCVSSAVFKDRNLKYVFRAQAHSDSFGLVAPDFLAANAKAKLGKAPEALRIAIIHEDGPYGRGVASGNVAGAQKHRMQVVLKQGYPRATTDLSSLIEDLKEATPDIVLHTGYFGDVSLFLDQAGKAGLGVKAIVGQGGGYNLIDKLRAKLGPAADHIINVAPVAAQLLDPNALAAGLGDLTVEMARRYKAEKKTDKVPSYVSIGFNQTWTLLTDVLPRAIKTYGGLDAESLRKAAVATRIPPSGTIQGYGVEFYPPGHPMAGQNKHALPVVMQYVGDETRVIWPPDLGTAAPVLPLPGSSPYAAM